MAVQVDGDGQHDAAFLSRMAEYLEESGADMVIGSRFIEKKGFQSTGARRMGIKYFTWLIRLLTGKTVTDPTSGLRMVNRKVMEEFSVHLARFCGTGDGGGCSSSGNEDCRDSGNYAGACRRGVLYFYEKIGLLYDQGFHGYCY